MHVVGFDVAKDSLVGARIDRSGQVKERLELHNTRATIVPVLTELRLRYKHLVVASEATGDYHRMLALTCLELGIPFRLLNPLTVKRYIRTSIRKRKTDKTDAEAIAHVAAQGEGTVLTVASLTNSKPILRTSVSLTEMSQSLELMQQRLAPLLEHDTELLQALSNCQQQLGKATVQFREVASAKCDQQLIALLRSIPGIGERTAPAILIELGDIARFTGPRQVIGYAGLDPRVMQSGSTLNRYGHITKRGAPHLRRALYMSATIAKRHDPVCRALYEKKRAEGKRYKEAILVVARKLLRIIYAVWMSGEPYEVRY